MAVTAAHSDRRRAECGDQRNLSRVIESPRDHRTIGENRKRMVLASAHGDRGQCTQAWHVGLRETIETPACDRSRWTDARDAMGGSDGDFRESAQCGLHRRSALGKRVVAPTCDGAVVVSRNTKC